MPLDNETVDTTEVEQPQDDLRSSIVNAMREVEAKEAEPAAETSTAAPRERDEAGKFAAKSPDTSTAVTTQQQPTAEAAASTVPTPPRGWSPNSKVAFNNLPEFVRADIAKREAEVDAGFAKYSGLDQYVQQFEAAGVRLPDAIAAYRSAETQLEQNFPQGIVGLCQQFDVHPVALANTILQRYGQAPSGQQQQTGATDPRLQQHIASLEARLNNYEGERRNETINAVNTDIEKFITDPSNKFVDNVVDQMLPLIKDARERGQKVDLKEAYEAACWLNPEIRQMLINEQLTAKSKQQKDKARDAANQARASAASVTGAPTPGINTDAASQRTLRDDIKDAMDAAMGRV